MRGRFVCLREVGGLCLVWDFLGHFSIFFPIFLIFRVVLFLWIQNTVELYDVYYVLFLLKIRARCLLPVPVSLDTRSAYGKTRRNLRWKTTTAWKRDNKRTLLVNQWRRKTGILTEEEGRKWPPPNFKFFFLKGLRLRPFSNQYTHNPSIKPQDTRISMNLIQVHRKRYPKQTRRTTAHFIITFILPKKGCLCSHTFCLSHSSFFGIPQPFSQPSHPLLPDPPDEVLISASGIVSSCGVAGCLAARSFRCFALLGIQADWGSCVLPIEGVPWQMLGSLLVSR